MSSTGRRFSTGLPFLDRMIGGGLPVGGLLAITAPSASQSELFLKRFLRNRRTRFVSTVRPETEVVEWARAGAEDPPDLSVASVAPAAPLEDPAGFAEEIPPESFVIVDTVDRLEETSRPRYLPFLDALKEQLRAVDSIGVLHCTSVASPPPRRSLTLARADQVWQLKVAVLSRQIKNRLVVTKARYGRALTEPVDVLLTDRVQIDTSRRIA